MYMYDSANEIGAPCAVSSMNSDVWGCMSIAEAVTHDAADWHFLGSVRDRGGSPHCPLLPSSDSLTLEVLAASQLAALLLPT